uniref:Uncharacterized protein n=1 Tax=Arundo donax TaxID=35708 RepID=A0A0A9F0S7_ARUDO
MLKITFNAHHVAK